MQKPRHHFTVGWICALELELTASRVMLDEEYAGLEDQDDRDDNIYVPGRIGSHDIIMACLPLGCYGIERAAKAATDMMRSFPSLRFGFMVGIGGAIPSSGIDIRLGDVVVSSPQADHGGVIQYDFGKVQPDGKFERRGSLNKPPVVLLNAVQRVKSDHRGGGSNMARYLQRLSERSSRLGKQYRRPPVKSDQLRIWKSGSKVESCGLIPFVRRGKDGNQDLEPHIHYGLIASGTKVIANAAVRDRLRGQIPALCVETEAAGLMDHFPCLVIRGMCDYADGCKNDEWQCYAAAAAAAYTRELIAVIQPKSVLDTQRAKEKLGNITMQMQYNHGQMSAVHNGDMTYNRNTYHNYYGSGRGTADRTEPSESSVQSCFGVPFARDAKFIGREAILNDIADTITTAKIFRMVGIYGLGGIGKSQIAIEYAHRYREERPNSCVIWLYAASTTELENSFRGAAQSLKLPSADDPKADHPKLLHDWLLACQTDSWLVIVDNADHSEVIWESRSNSTDLRPLLHYIPQSANGALLLTTRDRQVVRDRQFKLFHVQPMEQQDAVSLLRLYVQVPPEEEHQALQLVKVLDHIPLAICQAGAYLAESDLLLTLQEYLDELHNDSGRLVELLKFDSLDLRRHHSAQHAVLKTWVLSFRRIQQKSPSAADLLALLAMYCNSHMPLELVQDEHISNSRQDLQLLSAFSLISLHTDTRMQKVRKSCSMHSLVHTATRQWLKANGTLCYWQRTSIVRMTDKFPFCNYDSFLFCKQLIPHAQHVVVYPWHDDPAGDFQRLALFSSICQYQVFTGNYSSAVVAARSALDLSQSLTDDGFVLLSQEQLAGTLILAGQYLEAEKLQRNVVENSKAICGPDHHDTLERCSSLSHILSARGKTAEALAMQVITTGRSTELHGRGHPVTSQHMLTLASLYMQDQNLARSEEILLQILEQTKQMSDQDIGMVHASIVMLAQIPQRLGRRQEVESLLTELIASIEQRMELVDGPPVLVSRLVLECLHQYKGVFDEAEKLPTTTLESGKEQFERDHPWHLMAMARLAFSNSIQGRLEEAENILLDLLEIKKKRLGSEHSDTIRDMDSLGTTYLLSERLAEAQAMHTEIESLKGKVD